jgi:serine protease AprX
MRRNDRERLNGVRSSALWTKSGRGRSASEVSRGELRSSALWGKGGRGLLAVFALTLALIGPSTSIADTTAKPAFVPASLLTDARAHPSKLFRVIVQGKPGKSSATIAQNVRAEDGKIKRRFFSIAGVAASVDGSDLLKLRRHPNVFAITPDARLAAAESGSGSDGTSSGSSGSSGSGSSDGTTSNTLSYASAPMDSEMWRESVRVDQLWALYDPLTGLEAPAPQAPAIAIVDSGVDASRLADFGTRVVASVNLSSLSPNATGDGQGHGTMVAGIAAGASPFHPGVAQNAPIVSIRTSDAEGRSVTSDVIAAADWILANKKTYGIRVANFSLSGSMETSFRFDPLDKAVERLWFNGVVVVAAAGNHGSADGPVSMSYAPGNDPFIITVGALDVGQTGDPYDDSVPYWSGFGYTMDGFSKPDMAAPGRYMVMPVPAGASIPARAPERVVAPGYMWMSGTSFAAPVVAGTAAQLLARHPDWGPNEVKGALMLTSAYLGGQASGVGEIDAAYAASLDFRPPNPNENFYPFVQKDLLSGQLYFNGAAWASAVQNDAAWSSAAWSSAAWASAAWASAAWASAAWSSAAWSSAELEASLTRSTATLAE